MRQPAFTKHALEVMNLRDVTVTEVEEVLRYYDNRYPSTTHRGRPAPNNWVYQKGGLGVVVDTTDPQPVVITVLLRSRTPWNDEDARARTRSPRR